MPSSPSWPRSALTPLLRPGGWAVALGGRPQQSLPGGPACPLVAGVLAGVLNSGRPEGRSAGDIVAWSWVTTSTALSFSEPQCP